MTAHRPTLLSNAGLIHNANDAVYQQPNAGDSRMKHDGIYYICRIAPVALDTTENMRAAGRSELAIYTYLLRGMRSIGSVVYQPGRNWKSHVSNTVSAEAEPWRTSPTKPW